MMNRQQFFASVFWAAELSQLEQERARRGITIHIFDVGSSLIHRGDQVDSWIGVIEGFLKLGSVTRCGQPVSYVGLPAGCWFGEGSLLKSEPRRYDVVALRPTRIAKLDRNTFFWLYENSTAFNRLLVRLFNERLSHLIALVEHERTLNATGKVARGLAWLANPIINPLMGNRININQREIGLLTGVSRQVANKTLQELEIAKLLRVEHGGVTILDLERLRGYGD